MQKAEPLIHENKYHIYNCGINGCNIFKETENYQYFLKLYDKYIRPIGETYAWILMPNHFHLLIRIKDKNEITDCNPNPDRVQNPVRVKKATYCNVCQPFQGLES